MRGIVAGMSVRNPCIERPAIVSPKAPLTRANETFSVSSCRASRAGRAPSAERRANCELPLSTRCARDHEIGNICARDQKHHTHCAKQDQERHADPRIEHRVLWSLDPHTPVSIRSRELVLHAGGEATHVVPGLIQ